MSREHWVVQYSTDARHVWEYAGVLVCRRAEEHEAFATPPSHYLSLLRQGFNLGRQAGWERVILTLKTCWLKLVLRNSIPLNAFGPEPRGLALTSTDTVSSAWETHTHTHAHTHARMHTFVVLSQPWVWVVRTLFLLLISLSLSLTACNDIGQP